MKVHQSTHNYPHIDRLVSDTMKHYNSLEYLSEKYGQFYFEDKDGFFLDYFTDVLKFYKLGTKAANPRVHFMETGASHLDGHDHQIDTGVFYIQAQKDSGDLVLMDSKITIIPEVNYFVGIPAREMHSIGENKNFEIRMALVFDIIG